MLEQELFLTMPWPPSVNNMYSRSSWGVYMTDKARDFKKFESWNIYNQAVTQVDKSLPITETVELIVKAYPPDKRKRDDDNIQKILSDVLVQAKVLGDDSLIKKRTTEIYYFDDLTKNRGIEIKIKPFKQSKGNI